MGAPGPHDDVTRLVEQSPDVLSLHAADGRYLVASPSSAHVLGRRADELTGTSAYAICHPDDAGRLGAAHAAALADRSDRGRPASVVYRVVRPDGSDAWVETTCRRAILADGSTAVACSTRSAVERARAEEELRRLAGRWEGLLETLPTALWMSTPAGELTFVSRRWEEIMRRPLEHALGMAWRDVIHPDDLPLVDAAWSEAVANEGLYRVEARYVRGDGEVSWIRDRAGPVRAADGSVTGWVGTVEDVSEQVRAQAALELRARQQALVAELGSRALDPSVTLAQLMEAVVDAAVDGLAIEHASLFELQADGRDLLLVATRGTTDEPERVGRLRLAADATSLAGRALAAEDGVVATDDASTVPLLGPRLGQIGLHSVLAARIGPADAAYGVLGAYSVERAAFNDDDVHFIESLANVFANGLARRRTDLALRTLAEEGAALRRVAMTVAEGADPGVVFALIAQEVASLFGGDSGFVLRLEEGRLGRVVGSWHAPRAPHHLAVGSLVQYDEAALTQLETASEPVRLGGPNAPPGSLPELGERVGAPIRVGARLWGSLTAASTRPGGIPSDAEPRLRRFAALAALAIANADRRAAQEGINSAILDASSDGIAMYDDEGELAFANPALGEIVRRIVGESGSDALAGDIGQLAQALAARCVDHEAALEALLDEESRGELETIHDERIYLCERATVRTAGGDPIGRMLALRDVTAERTAVRLKTELLSTVSHELRTPLASILGFAELLIVRRPEPEVAERYAGIIHASAQRLTGLLDTLLDLQRIEEGRLDLERADFDLRALIEREGELLAASSADHEVVVQLPDEPLVVHAERDRIGQVIDNLLSNAIKYSPDGGRVQLRAERVGASVRVTVSDTGVGIPADQQGSVFERFFRASSSGHRGISGNGLGLALAHDMVAAHGGTMGFESHEGAGSTFWFDLPLRVETSAGR